MEHGFSKLSKGPDTFATILQAIGVPVPHFMAWLRRVGSRPSVRAALEKGSGRFAERFKQLLAGKGASS